MILICCLCVSFLTKKNFFSFLLLHRKNKHGFLFFCLFFFNSQSKIEILSIPGPTALREFTCTSPGRLYYAPVPHQRSHLSNPRPTLLCPLTPPRPYPRRLQDTAQGFRCFFPSSVLHKYDCDVPCARE